MSALDRLTNVLRGRISERLNALESNNPEAVIAAAQEAGEERYLELRGALAGLVTQRDKLGEEVQHADAELAQLAPALEAALMQDDDDTALVLQEHKLTLQAQRRDAEARQEAMSLQLEEGKQGLIAFRAELEALKQESHSLLARHALAQATIQTQETLSGLSDDADVRGLATVRDHVQRLHAQANEGYLNEEGESVRAKVEANAELSRKQRAQLELDRLKAAMGNADAPAAHAEASSDAEPAEPPSPTGGPKRTL